MKLAPKDLVWLKNNYPSLKKMPGNVLQGRLRFRMLHANGRHYVTPNADLVAKAGEQGVYIAGAYEVRITWDNADHRPKVFEIGGRLSAVATAMKKDMLDMHTMGEDQSLCLASPLVLVRAFQRGFDLQQYIEGFLVPYLFAQSHFELTGNWLWGELSHDIWGHLEELGEQRVIRVSDLKLTARLVVSRCGVMKAKEIFSTRCRWHLPCPCESGKRNFDCHPDIQKGISRIRGEVSRRTFTIEGLG